MILSLGEESVRREFLKILPRIYRYKFDPASKVGSVMSEVWNALIEDPRTVFSSPTVVADLCRELISNADSRVWRVREAVLGGFEDLAHNVIDWNCVSPYVEDLFRISNILTDDIKETVRKAAVKAASSVNAAMVRWSESSEPALRKCMQILLDNSNRVNAKKTLEKLLSSSASKRPELVRDFISRLIPIMLESLSSEESADMNYAQFHAESMLNVTKEDMESLRLEAARTSPPQRVIDSLLPLLNDSIVTELCGFVYETIRSGVGLVTRVSCAKLILHCIKFHPAGVREAGPAKLIKVFLNVCSSNRSVF
jgi:proteasome component ECM29